MNVLIVQIPMNDFRNKSVNENSMRQIERKLSLLLWDLRTNASSLTCVKETLYSHFSQSVHALENIFGQRLEVVVSQTPDQIKEYTHRHTQRY